MIVSRAPASGRSLAPGESGWVTLMLTPGTYEVVCNLANHYVDGMCQQFTVTTL